MTVYAAGRYYPSYFILLTIPILVSSTSLFANNGKGQAVIATSFDDDAESISPLPSNSSDNMLFAQDVEGLTNVPIHMCDSSQQRNYADLTTAYLSPPCEKAFQGYCGIRRNKNYTLIIKFLPKVPTKSLSVRVTSIDPTFGWETPLWPEFNVCSDHFNITCPPTPNDLVQAFLYDSVPAGVPAMRALVRVRLLGMGMENSDTKKVYICRQLNLQVY